jgi:hypothetical protein
MMNGRMPAYTPKSYETCTLLMKLDLPTLGKLDAKMNIA